MKLLIQEMVLVKYREYSNFEFAPVFRVYVAGASQTGKTFFAQELLKRKLFDVRRCYYFHPDYNEDEPVDWCLDVPILYDSEFPTTETFLKMPENSVVILDDLVEECFKSSVIDYLFRVLSSKRKLHVILMAQRYYHNGRYSVSIRNSSNYHVLMRTVNRTMTSRISTDLGLKKEVAKAIEFTSDQCYPHILIDRTPKARANKLEVFINLFDKHFVVVRNSMKYFLISEQDFRKCFTPIDSEIAKYEDKKNEPSISSGGALTETNNPTEAATLGAAVDEEPSNTNSGNVSGSESDRISVGSQATTVSSSIPRKRVPGSWKRQKEFEKRFRRALHKYSI